MDACEGCGFDFDEITVDDIAPRTQQGVADLVAMLDAGGDVVTQRPSPERWSTLEYVAHVRDVMITIRDRLVVGLVEDEPGFTPMYREQRVDLGLYRADTAADLAPELEAAASMLLRLFSRIDPTSLDRPVQYGFPEPARRTLAWMGKQAVHEIEHHGDDVRQNARLLIG